MFKLVILIIFLFLKCGTSSWIRAGFLRTGLDRCYRPCPLRSYSPILLAPGPGPGAMRAKLWIRWRMCFLARFSAAVARDSRGCEDRWSSRGLLATVDHSYRWLWWRRSCIPPASAALEMGSARPGLFWTYRLALCGSPSASILRAIVALLVALHSRDLQVCAFTNLTNAQSCNSPQN